MSYSIESFDPENSEEIITKQVEIGKSILSNWRNANQTGVDRLKQQYQGEEFDPETRLYAYHDDTIVGFVTSSIVDQEEGKKKARLEIPIVPETHKEARHQLLEAALDVLKDKGANEVRTRAGPNWGYTLEFVDQYDFRKSELMSRISEFDPAELDLPARTEELSITTYDDDKHRNLLGHAFREKYGIEDDAVIDDALDQLIDGRIEVHYHGLIISDNTISGRILAYSIPDSDGPVVLGAPLLLVEEEVEKEIVAKELISDAISKLANKGITDIRQTLFTNALQLEPIFEQFGLTYNDDLAYYDKEL